MLPALAMLLRPSWRVLWLLPSAAGYVALRWTALGGLFPPPEQTLTYGFSLEMRIKTVVIGFGEYLRLSVLPSGQTLYYGHLRDSLLGLPWGELAWIVAGVVVLPSLARLLGWRLALTGAGWFLLGLLPVLNIVAGGVLVAERCLYLPLFGVALLAARLLPARRWVWALVLFLCAAAGTWAVTRWRTEESLWRSTLAAHPRSPMAHVWLGRIVLARGELGEAEGLFAEAGELNPDLAEAYDGQARVALARGDCAGAVRLAAEAARRSRKLGAGPEFAACRGK
jgi:hypothetical protein